jgi:hypothetical protein
MNVSIAPITPTHTQNHIPFSSIPPHPHTNAGPSSQSHPHTNHIFDILHDSLTHPNTNNNNEPHHLCSPTMPTRPELDSPIATNNSSDSSTGKRARSVKLRQRIVASSPFAPFDSRFGAYIVNVNIRNMYSTCIFLYLFPSNCRGQSR